VAGLEPKRSLGNVPAAAELALQQIASHQISVARCRVRIDHGRSGATRGIRPDCLYHTGPRVRRNARPQAPGKFEGHAVGWCRDRFPAVLGSRGTRCDTGRASGPLRPAFPHGSIARSRWAEPCPRFASRGKSGCRRRHWARLGVFRCMGDPGVRNLTRLRLVRTSSVDP
jgi:hypothetical protein